ncbi:MAG: type II toxin-antitoxin system PemK/MazF family toxin [Lachnospiraceae bacterium]|nr:type II toxin-antitoxin system PemK/MazF family toxin [Lachnospiraceae bacterium]
MQDVINGGIYAVDLKGTYSYEFVGVHPAMVIRTLKEKDMYYIVPLTTYTKEKWEKCRRKGYVTRIISTNSIARIDKINIVSRRQVGGRYYNSGKMVIPDSEEIEKVMKRVDEYIFLSNGKATKEYKKYLEQRGKLALKINGYLDGDSAIIENNNIIIELSGNECSFLSNADIKDIINTRMNCSDVKISKSDDIVKIEVILD